MEDGDLVGAGRFHCPASRLGQGFHPLWPLQRRERAALLALNVPHFVSPSDSTSVEDASGFAVRTQAIPGLDRARARAESLDEDDIAWQIDVIRHSTSALSRSGLPPPTPPELKEPSGPAVSAAEIFDRRN